MIFGDKLMLFIWTLGGKLKTVILGGGFSKFILNKLMFKH